MERITWKTQEGRRLPVKHCIKGTPDGRLIPALEKLQQEHHWPVIQKPSFGSVTLAEDLKELHRKQPIQSIELIGLCTDICVVSNALLLKAALPEVEIRVDSRCCAGVTEESHQAALETMRSCQVVCGVKKKRLLHVLLQQPLFYSTFTNSSLLLRSLWRWAAWTPSAA